MRLDFEGEKANNVYDAFGRQPSAQNGPVEYEEFDDRLTVKATVDGGRSNNVNTILWRSSRVFPCTDRLWDLDKILCGWRGRRSSVDSNTSSYRAAITYTAEYKPSDYSLR